MHFDVKPDYRDTPRDWHSRLESAFYFGETHTPKRGKKR